MTATPALRKHHKDDENKSLGELQPYYNIPAGLDVEDIAIWSTDCS